MDLPDIQPNTNLGPQLSPENDLVLEQKVAIPYTTTLPSFTPSFNGVRRIYYDGTNYIFYIYANGGWRTQTLGGSFVGGRMYRSGAQSINDTTTTKVAFNAATIAGTGLTGDTTNNRFTITTAGTYYIQTAVTMTLLAGNYLDVYLYKNNASYAKTRTRETTDNADLTAQYNDIISLAANDYVEIFVNHNAGVAKNVSGGEDVSYFSIHKI